MEEIKKDNKIKVLYVDDDPFLLDMYGLKFTNSGYDITTVPVAGDALKMLREGKIKPDIMLFDIVMPYMDGLTLVEIIKKEKLEGDAVIIMLTNQGGADDIDRSRELKVDGYIVKATSIPSEVVQRVSGIYEQVKNSRKKA